MTLRTSPVGFDAMMRGDGDVVSGWKNKLQSAIANVTPAGFSLNSTAGWRSRDLPTKPVILAAVGRGYGHGGAMPFKSQAQRRKFAQLLVEGKISNETYEEWNRETGARKLPERVRPAGPSTPARRKAKAAPRRKGRHP